jgi:hypothetical protein
MRMIDAVLMYAISKRRYNFSFDEVGRALFSEFAHKGETLAHFKKTAIQPALTALVASGHFTRPMRAIYMYVR